MADEEDPIHARVCERLGAPMGSAGPSVAPEPVNVPMIRHWVDALDDRNPVYVDAVAAQRRFGGIVAPPAMMQSWTMGRPQIAGIAERGGAAGEIDTNSPLAILADAGFVGTLATNSELEFVRYLQLGDHLESTTALESVSELKSTGIGHGYFVTWLSSYTDATGEVVGRQSFRVFKFKPGPAPDRAVKSSKGSSRTEMAPPSGEELPPFDLDVTATVVVAGAIASRDFMPVHHDRDYAQGQGAPDIFMNILTSTGYVSRFVTDWSGPDTIVRNIAIRLGAPAVPGKVLRFRGQVAAETDVDGERIFEVAVQAESDLGLHLSGSVVIALP